MGYHERVGMNTTAMGDAFEERAFALLRQVVKSGQTHLNPSICRFRRKPRYFSKKRDSEIEFDASVESWPEGANRFSHALVLECKNLSRKVSVDDIEEFDHKLTGCLPGRGKGVVLTPLGFQSGAITTATNVGIGLVAVAPDDALRWVLQRPSAGGLGWKHVVPDGVIHSSLLDAGKADRYGIGCRSRGGYTVSLSGFLNDLLSPSLELDEVGAIWAKPKPPVVQVPFVPNDQIELKVGALLEAIDYSGGLVDLSRLTQHARNGRTLAVVEASDAQRVAFPNALGSLDFSKAEIVLFADAVGSASRQRFTLAHELGHWFLGHDKWLRRETCWGADFSQAGDVSSKYSDIDRLEWQANCFASCLLMPEREVREMVAQLVRALDIRNRGHGVIFVDDQPCNRRSFRAISAALCEAFGVSREALKLRLLSLSLLADQRGNVARLGFGQPRISRHRGD